MGDELIERPAVVEVIRNGGDPPRSKMSRRIITPIAVHMIASQALPQSLSQLLVLQGLEANTLDLTFCGRQHSGRSKALDPGPSEEMGEDSCRRTAPELPD